MSFHWPISYWIVRFLFCIATARLWGGRGERGFLAPLSLCPKDGPVRKTLCASQTTVAVPLVGFFQHANHRNHRSAHPFQPVMLCVTTARKKTEI